MFLEEGGRDGAGLLAELSARWRAAQTLEYRSTAVMQHVSEPRIVVETHARLWRPGRARLVFRSDRPEAARVRVSDGRYLYDRRLGPQRRTTMTWWRGRLSREITHPLDDASYSVDQFFAPQPFQPPPYWGETNGPVRVDAQRTTTGKTDKRDVFRVTLARGSARDTLTLDALSFAPLEFVRIGAHGGVVQELLRETFTLVRLGVSLPPDLFVWTNADESGVLR